MVHEPFGVVAAVLPFNWPVSVFGNKVLPALLAGNTVVVKAPPTCPGAVLAAAAAMAEALPPGVMNAVNGPGPELGEMLVAHPGVDMVSFTGGVPTGRAVMAAASGAVRPVVLELGGNDPAIVAPDVDIDDALADKHRRARRSSRPARCAWPSSACTSRRARCGRWSTRSWPGSGPGGRG